MLKNRNYGVDLLRIVSMYMVVILHILGNGGVLRNLEVLSLNFFGAWLLEISCYCAVNCYALITGYVMVDSKFKYKKIFNLWLDVLFLRLFLTFVMNCIYPDLVGKMDFFYSCFNIIYNSYWYFSAYFILYFFIPYINKLISVLDKNLYKRLILTIVCLMSFINLVSDSFALSGGYSFIWLMALYFIGGYIKKYNIGVNIKKKYFLLGIIFFVLMTFGVTMFFMKYPNLTFKLFGEGILVNYTSFTILGIAVGLLLIFSRLNISNKYFRRFIRRLAPATFGVYIIHEHSVVKKIFMTDQFSFISSYNWYSIIFMVLFFAFLIYMICSYMEMFRKYIFKKLNLYIISDYIYSIVRKLMIILKFM